MPQAGEVRVVVGVPRAKGALVAYHVLLGPDHLFDDLARLSVIRHGDLDDCLRPAGIASGDGGVPIRPTQVVCRTDAILPRLLQSGVVTQRDRKAHGVSSTQRPSTLPRTAKRTCRGRLLLSVRVEDNDLAIGRPESGNR